MYTFIPKQDVHSNFGKVLYYKTESLRARLSFKILVPHDIELNKAGQNLTSTVNSDAR